jgi:hypothetical protein
LGPPQVKEGQTGGIFCYPGLWSDLRMPALPECDMLKPWPVKEVADLIVGQQKIRELLQKE